MALLEPTPAGLYCPAGDFHIDPWRPVPRAVLTHAHADHARPGSARYHAAAPGIELLRLRLGPEAPIESHRYGEPFPLGRARVSLHPAGHILGSAQVRIEVDGEVAVVTGDFKRDPDPTCAPFEPVACDLLVTEATFALPVYRWPPAESVAREVLAWWDACARRRVPAVLACYALGKAQRLLAELARLTERPVHLHGAMTGLVEAYRRAGVAMLPTVPVAESARGRDFAGELILAPPSALGAPWMRRFGDAATGFASGWMQVRGHRRRRGYDRGFVLSDHADWPGLLATVRDSGARRIIAMHGDGEPLVRHLRERGLAAECLGVALEREEGSA
jgi:putative mRNA 3-end processing factor